LEFLNSQPYYASKKIVIQSSDFPVRRTGSCRHKKSTADPNLKPNTNPNLTLTEVHTWTEDTPVLEKIEI